MLFRTTFSIALVLLFGSMLSAQSANMTYDSTLARQLGADDIGMRKYVMAFLKKGPNRDQDPATAQAIQRGHMDNITR
ncbi:MAG: hypothetical protein QUS07_05575, partial [Methanothrix sp.]|nr:hypothetical protein [Methanothrix sp.]